MEEMLLNNLDGQKMADLRMVLNLCVFVALTAGFFKLTQSFFIRLKTKLENSNVVRFLPLFEKTVKGLILFFMIATFLQSHGYSLSALIAGFGITGLAVGFAAKETISSAFGAIAIIADKSFQIGDHIVVSIAAGAAEGVVEDINMRSTKLRAPDGTLFIVPNNLMAASVIKNLTAAK